MNITTSTKVTRVANAAAAAQTDVTSSSVDMKGFFAVTFAAAVGSIASTGTVDMHAEGSDDDSSWSNLTGATITQLGDADDNKLALLEITDPRQRYVRVVVERGTADSSVDSIVAIQSEPQREPTTHSTTVDSATLVHAPAAA
jgi:hypothetical protein